MGHIVVCWNTVDGWDGELNLYHPTKTDSEIRNDVEDAAEAYEFRKIVLDEDSGFIGTYTIPQSTVDKLIEDNIRVLISFDKRTQRWEILESMDEYFLYIFKQFDIDYDSEPYDPPYFKIHGCYTEEDNEEREEDDI